jgi:hypothetical protein
MDEVFEDNCPSSHMKPDNRAEAGRFHPGNLCRREGTASSVITGHLSLRELFFSKLIESFFGAKTLITLSFVKQPIGKFTIGGQALSLAVWTIRSPSVGPFFPGNAQPSEIFYDPVDGGIGRSLDVRIFNTENKCSLVPFCKEEIEEGRPGVSDMEKPGWSRGKANPNF